MQETTTSIAQNPFALMMHPEHVLQAVEASAHLEGLRRRVYRPLDRPVPGGKGEQRDVLLADAVIGGED